MHLCMHQFLMVLNTFIRSFNLVCLIVYPQNSHVRDAFTFFTVIWYGLRFTRNVLDELQKCIVTTFKDTSLFFS